MHLGVASCHSELLASAVRPGGRAPRASCVTGERDQAERLVTRAELGLDPDDLTAPHFPHELARSPRRRIYTHRISRQPFPPLRRCHPH